MEPIEVVVKLVDQMSGPAALAASKVNEVARSLEIASDKANKVAAKQAEAAAKMKEVSDAAAGTMGAIKDAGDAVSSAYVPDAVIGPLARVREALAETATGFQNFGHDIAGYYTSAKSAIDEVAAKADIAANNILKAGAIMTGAVAGPMLWATKVTADFDAALAPLKDKMDPKRFEEVRAAVLSLGSAFPNATEGMGAFFQGADQTVQEQIASYRAAADASRIWGTDFKTTGKDILDMQKRLGLNSGQLQQKLEQINALPADQRSAAITGATDAGPASNQAQLAQKMLDDSTTASETFENKMAQISARLQEMGVKIATPWTDSKNIILGIIAQLSEGSLSWLEKVLGKVAGSDAAMSGLSKTLSVIGGAGSGLIAAGTGLKAIADGWSVLSAALSAESLLAAGSMAAIILSIVGSMAALFLIYNRIRGGMSAAPHNYAKGLMSDDPKVREKAWSELLDPSLVSPEDRAADDARQAAAEKGSRNNPLPGVGWVRNTLGIPEQGFGAPANTQGSGRPGAISFGGAGDAPGTGGIVPGGPSGIMSPGTDMVAQINAKLDLLLGKDSMLSKATAAPSASPGTRAGVAISAQGSSVVVNPPPQSVNITVNQNIAEAMAAPGEAGAATAAALAAASRRSLMDGSTEQ
jgi:hypothetical protein